MMRPVLTALLLAALLVAAWAAIANAAPLPPCFAQAATQGAAEAGSYVPAVTTQPDEAAPAQQPAREIIAIVGKGWG